MTAPAHIAENLCEDSFATRAAILMALIYGPSMAVLRTERHHMFALRRRGWVGLVLRNVHSLEARRGLREAGARLSQVLLDCESALARRWAPGAAKH